MWLSAIKIAMQAGSKIYANRQKTKIAMSEAQLMHADKMARGESLPGKIDRSSSIGLERRSGPHNIKFARVGARLGSDIRMTQQRWTRLNCSSICSSQLPSWFTNLWILVVASIYGIKGTQIFLETEEKIMGILSFTYNAAKKALRGKNKQTPGQKVKKHKLVQN